MPAGWQTRTLDVGDVRLNIAETGQGRPVLLLHGFPDSMEYWGAI